MPLSISYGDDPEVTMAILVEVGNSRPRVMALPAPVARLMAFADSGSIFYRCHMPDRLAAEIEAGYAPDSLQPSRRCRP